MKRSLFLVTGTVLASLVIGTGYADDAPVLRKAQVEEIVKEYLLKHPETIQASFAALREREMAKQARRMKAATTKHAEQLMNPSGSPTTGNPASADVTVTEFYDFHCGYCKQMVPAIIQLLQQEKGVRVIFRDFPILSPDSEIAARASVAFYRLNRERYFDFYRELMKSAGTFTQDSIEAMAGTFGVSAAALKAEMDKPETAAIVQANKKLAADLLISGTPALYVDTEALPGAATYEKLHALIEQVRVRKARGKE